MVTKGFLALNGYHLAAPRVAEADVFIRAVADHRIDRPAIVDWIETHSTHL